MNLVTDELRAVTSLEDSYEFIDKKEYFPQLSLRGRQVNIFQQIKGQRCIQTHLSCTLSSFLFSYTFFQIVPFQFKRSFVHFVVNIFSFLIGC